LTAVYLETSALLAWIFTEGRSSDVVGALASASCVAVSELTLLEAERAIVRGQSLGDLSAAQVAVARRTIDGRLDEWSRIAFADEVVSAARQRFPKESVRTLDAIHLAFVQSIRGSVPAIAILTLDDRVRENARALGIAVLP
jgi:predicted nucleic acid-binding protein